MIERIACLQELTARAEDLKGKGFRPGFDNMTASSAVIWMKIAGQALCEELRKGKYRPSPAIGWRVAKKNGKYRQLSRLTAIDTIVQTQLLSVLTPLCEEFFSPSSFAYRPGKSVYSALESYCRYGGQYRYAERLDPENCYDNIQYDVLEKAVNSIIGDRHICTLIMQFARTPLFTDGEIVQRPKGLLQGAPLSPLLCNIYLHSLDAVLEEKKIPFVRYADDIVLFSDSPEQLEKNSGLVKEQFKLLGLTLNQAKHAVDAPVQLEFLNSRFSFDKKGVMIVQEDNETEYVWHTWHKNTPRNPRRTIDILSDGILRQKDFSLAFESDEEKACLPIEAIENINVYSDVVFDSGFLKKAASRGIAVHLFDAQDRLIGHFLPTEALKAPRLTYEQLMAYYDEGKRLEIAKGIALASLHNIRLNMRYHRKQYPENDIYTAEIKKVDILQKKMKECGDHETLLMLEADVRKAYYACFEGFLRADDFRFEKRSRRPPENEINALLSFGNTVLYNWFASRINRSALDVRIAFLHATNRRKESLNLDLADIFKPLIVDRVALALINRRVLKKSHFYQTETGATYLTQDGKQIFLQAFYEKLDEQLMIKGNSLCYRDIMAEEIYKLVRYFRGQAKYTPYKQVR